MKPQMLDDTSARMKRLREYRETVARLFPALPGDLVDQWSLPDADALVLEHLLECYPREVLVLEVGTRFGDSAFHFAAHPKVREVVSAGANLEVSEAAAQMAGEDGETDAGFESLRSLRSLEVARAAISEFADEARKIRLEDSPGGVEVPVVEPREGASLVAFVGGLRDREAARENLEAVFAGNPRATAIVDGCRRDSGPFVQAGVVSFMEETNQEYRFRLLGDLGPGLASCGLGIVYPRTEAGEIGAVLEDLCGMFSGRLDPLRLLASEEELVETVSKLDRNLKQATAQANHAAPQVKKKNEQLEQRNSNIQKANERLRKNNSYLQQRNSWLEQQHDRLTAHYSSRRYRLADALAEGAFNLPILKKVLRREK